MAISDIDLVQYLLQGTEAVPRRIDWHENDGGDFVADVSGVRLELGEAHATTGSRVCLMLSLHLDKVAIVEPANRRLFRDRCDSKQERQLAALLRNLQVAAARQCSVRGSAVEEQRTIRETIFRRVLFDGAEMIGAGLRDGVDAGA
jgi:hypothetical protein